jgi:hypothetical protein
MPIRCKARVGRVRYVKRDNWREEFQKRLLWLQKCAPHTLSKGRDADANAEIQTRYPAMYMVHAKRCPGFITVSLSASSPGG